MACANNELKTIIRSKNEIIYSQAVENLSLINHLKKPKGDELGPSDRVMWAMSTDHESPTHQGGAVVSSIILLLLEHA